MDIESTEEGARLFQARTKKVPWRKWGPYLSERQWGTVREDYSREGVAWEYFPHDHARSRAYRWGEDGLAGISDEKQILCFSLALWNGQDPFLKERLFGLTGHEGNHGEDVKEYYFYLDNTPTHSYMKHLYKYPQKTFPYEDLVATNRKRDRNEPEYELLDTGIFDENRYFDIFTEYAKGDPDDLLIRFTVYNRGDEAAELTLLPHLFFRNTWSWNKGTKKPLLRMQDKRGMKTVLASHPVFGNYWLFCEAPEEVLFTENETNNEKLFQSKNSSPFVKDGIHAAIVDGKKDKVNPSHTGTKAAIVYRLSLAPKESRVVRLRLVHQEIENPFGRDFDATFFKRIDEADAFYLKVTPYQISEEMRHVQRQAFAGLLWNKQCYHYNVKKWLEGDDAQPKPDEARKEGRNFEWPYLNAFEIFSMPDKWEYPWFASWDLAFHAITFAMIDPEFAKGQLVLLTREWYMAPNGQIPAYEWNFSDVNPPVHAWAAMRVFQIEQTMWGRRDRVFLERVFQKLMLNFTWWVNRKDSLGRNMFEGGFLGLDNIGAFDRSLAPPSGGVLEQPDATGWMGMYCLNCLQIALELALDDDVYEDIATKFFEHFVYIADAINDATGVEEGLWDIEQGFYYGLLMFPDGKILRLKQDNMAGLVPLFAVATNDPTIAAEFPAFRERFQWFIEHHPEMLKSIADLEKRGTEKRILLAFASQRKLTRVLAKMLDEDQFFSPYGVRSASKSLSQKPYTINLSGKEFKLDYEPAESTTPLFGGNSNWRGPIWFPLNYLLIESLQKFHYYYDNELKVECPTGSGKMANLWEVSAEISQRLISIFLKDGNGKRPLYGNIAKFQEDPHWKNYILFHEYFHGDNGTGLGASNQTGWTALVAKMIHQYGKYKVQKLSPKLIEREKIGHV